MMNLYGGTGLGASGGGVSGGGGVSLPQLLAMIHGAGGSGGPGMGTPFQPGQVSTPMAGYIGAPQQGGGAMMPRPGMPAVAGNSAPQAMAQQMGSGVGGGTADLMKLLAQLRGGQTGVSPSGSSDATLPPGGVPSGAQSGGIPGTPSELAGAGGNVNPLLMQILLHMQNQGASLPGMAGGVTG